MIGKYGETVKVDNPKRAAIAELGRLWMNRIEGTAVPNEDGSVTVYGNKVSITYQAR